MAAVTDAKTAVGSAANWFKVSELGLVSNNPDYFGSRESDLPSGLFFGLI